jgi:hypothetical protein
VETDILIDNGFYIEEGGNNRRPYSIVLDGCIAIIVGEQCVFGVRCND